MAGSGLGAVFRAAEFRVLWSAELFSIAGDQLARVALAVLVYGRTGSAVWAAVGYALTFLPALNAHGVVTLTLSVDDKGNSGGSARGDTDTATITVAPVNDPPDAVDEVLDDRRHRGPM